MGMEADIRRLEDLDRAHIWHPFTQMKDAGAETPIIITEARDCFIKDIRGRWYLDAVSSIWVNVHGHGRQEINKAIAAQLEQAAHTTQLGLASVPAIELAARLTELLNKELAAGEPVLPRVFFSDNGSTSVEVALKMAFQYWRHTGVQGKNTFLHLNNAYHGDTLGAVSVGGVDLFHTAFEPLLFKTLCSPSPYCYRCELGLTTDTCKMDCLLQMEEILKEHSAGVAAVILEPLMQGAGGMIAAPKGFLKGVRSLCDKYDTLLIADEVATGFGRTGRMFACSHEGVVPDLICLSKSITGGYLPLAATVASDKIYNAFLGDYGELKTFFHGHSYTGNQLASAAALASLDLFDKDRTIENLQPKISLLQERLKEICTLPHVGDTRNIGFMAGVELVKDKQTTEPYPFEQRTAHRVCLKLLEKGVFLRPLSDVLIIIPPLAISMENLSMLLTHIRDAIEETT